MKHNECIPDAAYDAKYFTRFDPDLYDPRLWAQASSRAGMKSFGSEVRLRGFEPWQQGAAGKPAAAETVTPELPVEKPNVAVPVVELFLRG